MQPHPGLPSSTPRGFVSASSSEISHQPFLEGGDNCVDRAFGGRPSTLAVGNKNESPTAVYTYRADCLTWPALIEKNQSVSNITVRKYFVIDMKPDEVHYKLQNYV